MSTLINTNLNIDNFVLSVDNIIKIKLISFYYLIEIIKLRKYNAEYKYENTRLKSEVSKLNKIYEKHKDYILDYEKRSREHDGGTFKAKMVIKNPKINYNYVSKVLGVNIHSLYNIGTAQIMNLLNQKMKKDMEKSY